MYLSAFLLLMKSNKKAKEIWSYLEEPEFLLMHQLTKESKCSCCSRLQVKFCKELEFSMWILHIKLKSLKRNASRDSQRGHGTKLRAWSHAHSSQGLPKIFSNNLKPREKHGITFPSESTRSTHLLLGMLPPELNSHRNPSSFLA